MGKRKKPKKKLSKQTLFQKRRKCQSVVDVIKIRKLKNYVLDVEIIQLG